MMARRWSDMSTMWGASGLFGRAAVRLSLFKRALCLTLLGLVLSGCVHHTDLTDLTPEQRRKRLAGVRPDWTQHFEDVSQGAILISIQDRWLVYWEPGGARSHAFPVAVPLNDSLTKTGVTKVVRRKELPSWTATPEMIQRNPEVPRYIGPGPHNPLGEHALYLGWRYYAIHGTNTPGEIGDRATSGCFRLFSEDIKWLHDNVALGAPVKVMYSAEVQDAPAQSIGDGGAPSGVLPPSATQPTQPAQGPGSPVSSAPILDNPPGRTAPVALPPRIRDGRVYSTPILDNPPEAPVSQNRGEQPTEGASLNRG